MATTVSLKAPIAMFMALVMVFYSGAEAEFLPNNITVVGSVYCDACSNNTFSKHSFFLKGARVLIQCSFKVNSTMAEEIFLEAERTTDQHGVPPVDGFDCREGHELRSACRATLVRSSSSACNVPGLRGSTQHIALRGSRGAASACFLNLNALNFRPAKRDAALCHGGGVFGSSLFFWPFLLLLWPPFRLPFPAPGSGGAAAGGTVLFPWPFPCRNGWRRSCGRRSCRSRCTSRRRRRRRPRVLQFPAFTRRSLTRHEDFRQIAKISPRFSSRHVRFTSASCNWTLARVMGVGHGVHCSDECVICGAMC